MSGEEVLIAVDPHKGHNTLVVLDPVSRRPVEEAEFANTHAGYREMVRFARRWGQRRWAVEGCHGAGRYLAQRLVATDEVVLDVPAKLAARVRVFSQGHGRKTDRDDAVSIGLAALNAAGVQAVHSDGAMVSLRLWCDRRDELVSLRTQAICRLHRLLAELTPGGSSRELSATMAAAMLKLVRPKDDVSRERKALALQHLGDVRSLDRRIKGARDRIAAMVDANGTGLVNLFGVGPLVAGRVLAEVGDVSRFPTKDHFATYNGTAPIDVSSGEQVRHRLSRSGNRRVNHAVHIMAVVQIRNPKSEGRAYYERKRTEGKTAKEALRCLKRRLSDVIYRQLVADHYAKLVPCASPTTGRPTPSISTSPTRSSRVATPRPKPSRRPASKPGSPSTGKRAASSALRSSTPTLSSLPTSSSRPKTLRKKVISTSS
ncbi:MAG TPA: IS110 family transposase [Acidimicrobiales bacterium]|nr:IS110 family transposase [Acidimicrobiales bacterium]